MNRREFLQRLAAIGCVAATPKLIFDMGKNINPYDKGKFIFYEGAQGLYLDPMHNCTWEWISPTPSGTPIDIELRKVKGNMSIGYIPEAVLDIIISRK